ncbi:GntR family transcriptional regulator, partial [Sinorhizobium meliloti]|uniref:GntR family transcriptional regulator n=1 Tax=Rhizobium meliloti TaxID=382 RepID=UPI000FD5A24F
MFRPHEHKLGWDQSKVGQVYKALKNLVVNCEVPPRTRLDPTAISNVLKLKTSVTPVREALIQLETEGYIEILLGNGYYTKKLDTKTLSDHLDSTNMVLKNVFRENTFWHSKLVMLPRWDDFCVTSKSLELFYDGIAKASNNRIMRNLVHESNVRTRYIRGLDLHQP